MDDLLKIRIQEDMKAAMRAQDKELLSTIRFVIASVRQREIDSQALLDDAGIVRVIEKMIKQRYDSIAQYKAGNRPDLVGKEQREINLLQGYLPESIDEVEIDRIVNQAVEKTSATSIKDMGKVMMFLKEKLKDLRADMSLVSAKVKRALKST